MALAKKICRVCGNPYEACRSAKKDKGVFHWQEVACSPECGSRYLRMVNEARKVGTQDLIPNTEPAKEHDMQVKRKGKAAVAEHMDIEQLGDSVELDKDEI